MYNSSADTRFALGRALNVIFFSIESPHERDLAFLRTAERDGVFCKYIHEIKTLFVKVLYMLASLSLPCIRSFCICLRKASSLSRCFLSTHRDPYGYPFASLVNFYYILAVITRVYHYMTKKATSHGRYLKIYGRVTKLTTGFE
jgi:hypothetical protein